MPVAPPPATALWGQNVPGHYQKSPQGHPLPALQSLLWSPRALVPPSGWIIAPTRPLPPSLVASSCPSKSRESTCQAGELGLIPGLGRSPGEGNSYPLQDSGLENSMDCIVQGSQRVGHNWATFTSLRYLLMWKRYFLSYEKIKHI